MSTLDHLIAAALSAVDPRQLVAAALTRQRPVSVLAIGKAAVPMYRGAEDTLGDRIVSALVVGKHCADLDVEYLCGDHPIPALQSLRAAQRVMEFSGSLEESDELIVLLSGGASALVAAPVPGLTLDDLGQLTRRLIEAGASIDELNTVRRHLDTLKGGGLARHCRATITTYILSDVIGDRLEVIGSGLTAPNPTSREDAAQVLRKYGLPQTVPFEDSAVQGRHAEHVVLANCATAVHAAAERASELGFDTHVLTTTLRGEARTAGRELAQRLVGRSPERPVCLLAGGETTVTVRGEGKGGPCLELGLAAAETLSGTDAVLCAFATDGEDGSTGAAGVIVDGATCARAAALSLDVADHLTDNDSYGFFRQVGGVIEIGPTGTNVNDLIIGLTGLGDRGH